MRKSAVAMALSVACCGIGHAGALVSASGSTGVQSFLRASAAALTVSVSQSPIQAQAGDDVTFTANVVGAAPYTVVWDLEGDGSDDHTSINVQDAAPQLSITTRYPQRKDVTLRVRVTDDGGATVNAERAFRVASHNVAASNFSIAPVCGNGDMQVDPGESWRLTATLTNTGEVAPANAQAMFTPTLLIGQGAATDMQMASWALPVADGLLNTSTVSGDFYVKPGASCGSTYGLTYLGTLDYRGISGGGISGGVEIPATCRVVTSCPAPTSRSSIRQGSYFNPQRPGNGLVGFIIPSSQGAVQTQQFFGLWFTGEASRQPTWNFLQNAVIDGQATATIFRRQRNPANGSLSDQAIGTAQVTLLDNEQLAFTYQLGSQLRAGERLQHLFSGLNAGSPNRTGAWFYPQESGWGQTYDSFVDSRGVPSEFGLTYVYDDTGFPRWVLSQDSANQNQFPTFGYRTHCPACAWLEIGPSQQVLGTFTRQFTSANTGQLTTAFNVPGGGNWNRDDVQIVLLSVPQP